MKAKNIILSTLLIVLVSSFFGQTNQNEYNENLDVYRIVAVQNENEAITSVSNTIAVDKPLTLYAPNVFSPDGDGINDYFSFKLLGTTLFSVK